MHALRLGVDLGGTKIEIIALDAQGKTLLRRRCATPAGDYDATVRAVVELVHAAETELGSRGNVGVAMPGALSPASGLIKNANSTCLIGKPLDRDLSAALERPVRLRNDADCFALSEAVDGAAAGAECVFGVIVGTGTGGGVVVRQHLLAGPNAIAGEWGHNPLPWPRAGELPGPACYCGKRGCIETWLSGPGLAASYRRMGGAELSPPQIVSAAEHGEALARACLEAYYDRIARALASIVNVLDPHVIVLGGGMSNLTEIYREVPRRWGRYVFSDRVDTRLVRAMHGDSSGVRGAAWLWDDFTAFS